MKAYDLPAFGSQRSLLIQSYQEGLNDSVKPDGATRVRQEDLLVKTTVNGDLIQRAFEGRDKKRDKLFHRPERLCAISMERSGTQGRSRSHIGSVRGAYLNLE